MKQCDAMTLASTYSQAHRCLKTKGLKVVKRRRLCSHHRARAVRVIVPNLN